MTEDREAVSVGAGTVAPASEAPPDRPPPAEDPATGEAPEGDPPSAEPPVQEPPEEHAPVREPPPDGGAAPPEGPIQTAPGGELAELIEPLGGEAAPPLLEPGAEVRAPDGRVYRVERFLRTAAEIHHYSARVEPDGAEVWLREGTGDGAARLCQEAEVLAGLDSPFFPRVLALFEEEGRTCLVSDRIPERTLVEALRAGELSFYRVITVLAQVSAALSHLHRHGWAHLGLRPDGIALGKPVRLLDLTYAVRLGEKPPTPFYLAGYSPPELLTGGPVDARADVYGVGALLFHAVSGEPLAETGAELATWEPPAPRGGVPQILHRCLGAPETRYQRMEEVHQALLRLARRCAPAYRHETAAATDIGLEPTRTTNQDAYVCLTGRMETEEGRQAWAVLCVSDGMGGMAAGEVASDAAVRALLAEASAALGSRKTLSAAEQVELVREWMHRANRSACAAMEARRARGGATLVCACVLDRRLTVAHVGDCRLYLLRDGMATALTRDHSLVMGLALQGVITREEVRKHPDRSTISRSLGDRDPLPDYYVDTLEQVTGQAVMELEPGDLLLLCSDGLWEPVLEEDMARIVSDCAPDLDRACRELVRLALERGGQDNATVVLFRLDQVEGSGFGVQGSGVGERESRSNSGFPEP